MANIKLNTQYISTATVGLALTPAWGAVGVTLFPVFLMILNNNSNGTFEFSLDGINAFVFMQSGTLGTPSSITLNLKQMDLVIPENVTLFARRLAAAPVGSLRITLIGSASSISP